MKPFHDHLLKDQSPCLRLGRTRKSMKQVINDALRRALAQPPTRGETYLLAVHEATLRPSLDLARFNRLADELEDQAILSAQKRPES